jgi:hypothetical protein
MSNSSNNAEILFQNSRESKKPRDWAALTVLQFLVGGLVTMGGSLFALDAVNSFGTALGLIHLTIGIAGLLGAFVMVTVKPWYRNFLLAANILTIAYSSFSESLVEIQSLLPSFAAVGSLYGTVIAIIMSGAIIFLLARRNN